MFLGTRFANAMSCLEPGPLESYKDFLIHPVFGSVTGDKIRHESYKQDEMPAILYSETRHRSLCPYSDYTPSVDG
jgi:hypothetical protein